MTFDSPEEILEAENFLERARASYGARGHEPSERADDNSTRDPRDDCRKWRDAHRPAYIGPSDREKNRERHAANDVGRANAVRAMQVVAVGDQGIENVVANFGQVHV